MSKKILEYRIIEKKVDISGYSNLFYVQKLVKNFLGIKKWKTCGVKTRNFDANRWNPYEFSSYEIAANWIKEKRIKEKRNLDKFKYYYPERKTIEYEL